MFDFWKSVYGDWVGWEGEGFYLQSYHNAVQETFERQYYGTWLVLAAFCPLWVQRNAMQIYSFQMRLGPRVKIFQEKCTRWYFLLHGFSPSARFSFPVNFFLLNSPFSARWSPALWEGCQTRRAAVWIGEKQSFAVHVFHFESGLEDKSTNHDNHGHLVGAMTTRRIRAAVTMMLTRPYTTSTNVLTEEPGCKR